MSPGAHDTNRAGSPSRPGTAQVDVLEKTLLFHVKQAPRSLRRVECCRDKPGVSYACLFHVKHFWGPAAIPAAFVVRLKES